MFLRFYKFLPIILVLVCGEYSFAQKNLAVVQNNSTTYIPVYLREGTIYFSIIDFANAADINYFFNEETKKVELKFEDYLLKVSAKNPFVVITDKKANTQTVSQLPTSTYYSSNRVYMPLEFSIPILSEISGKNLTFEKPNRLVLTDKTNLPRQEVVERDTEINTSDITGISVDEKANGTLIRIKSKKRIPSYRSSYKNNILTLTFRKVNVDTSKINFTGSSGVLKKIVTANNGPDTEMKFYLGNEYSSNEVINVENSNDILITIHNKLFTKNERTSKKEKWNFDVIVIDAGHGGKDPGAIGVNGIKEKDINLAIALKLGKLIENNLKDVKVVYTRKKDVFLDLYKRGKIANENEGKLFISIHCNVTPKKPSNSNGFEVYLLRPGRTQEAIEIAETENSVIQFEENPERYQQLTDENFILVSMAQSSYMKYSEKFAELLHKEFDKNPNIKSRGVKQAGFYVLVGASMPSVLVESGFISNKNDAAYLNSKKGQEEFSNYVFNAIKKYMEHYEKEMQSD